MKGYIMKIAIIEFSQVNNFSDKFCQYLDSLSIPYEIVLLNRKLQVSQDSYLKLNNFSYLVRDTGVVDHEYRRVFLGQLNENAKIYPSLELILKFETKAQVYFWLQHKNQPILPFYLLPAKLAKEEFDLINTDKHFSEYKKFVIKPLRSNQGIGVNIFENRNRLWDFVQTALYQNNTHWLIQPFVEDAREFRLLLLNHKVFKVFEKDVEAGKGNLFQGAQMREIKLSEFVSYTGYDPTPLAHEFSTYTAIDFLFSVRSKLGFIIDVNIFPGLKILNQTDQANIFNHVLLTLNSN